MVPGRSKGASGQVPYNQFKRKDTEDIMSVLNILPLLVIRFTANDLKLPVSATKLPFNAAALLWCKLIKLAFPVTSTKDAVYFRVAASC